MRELILKLVDGMIGRSVGSCLGVAGKDFSTNLWRSWFFIFKEPEILRRGVMNIHSFRFGGLGPVLLWYLFVSACRKCVVVAGCHLVVGVCWSRLSCGVGSKDECLENELGRETSIIHSNQRGLIRRGPLPVHLPRSISKEFFYRGIWTFYAHQKRVDHPKNGTISQQLWDNITDLIQQKSRYQLAAGGANRKTRTWRIPSAASSTSCSLQRWDHQEAGSDVLLMGKLWRS